MADRGVEWGPTWYKRGLLVLVSLVLIYAGLRIAFG